MRWGDGPLKGWRLEPDGPASGREQTGRGLILQLLWLELNGADQKALDLLGYRLPGTETAVAVALGDQILEREGELEERSEARKVAVAMAGTLPIEADERARCCFCGEQVTGAGLHDLSPADQESWAHTECVRKKLPHGVELRVPTEEQARVIQAIAERHQRRRGSHSPRSPERPAVAPAQGVPGQVSSPPSAGALPAEVSVVAEAGGGAVEATPPPAEASSEEARVTAALTEQAAAFKARLERMEVHPMVYLEAPVPCCICESQVPEVARFDPQDRVFAHRHCVIYEGENPRGPYGTIEDMLAELAAAGVEVAEEDRGTFYRLHWLVFALRRDRDRAEKRELKTAGRKLAKDCERCWKEISKGQRYWAIGNGTRVHEECPGGEA